MSINSLRWRVSPLQYVRQISLHDRSSLYELWIPIRSCWIRGCDRSLPVSSVAAKFAFLISAFVMKYHEAQFAARCSLEVAGFCSSQPIDACESPYDTARQARLDLDSALPTRGSVSCPHLHAATSLLNTKQHSQPQTASSTSHNELSVLEILLQLVLCHDEAADAAATASSPAFSLRIKRKIVQVDRL